MTAFAPRPHHDGSPLYVSDESPTMGQRIAIRLRVPATYPAVARVHARAKIDGEPAWFEATRQGSDDDGWSWWEAPLVAANAHTGYRWMLEHTDGTIAWLNQAGLSGIETRDSEDFAVVATNPPPAWMDDSVMYQVFPDRFARSANSGDRDWPGWAIPAEWDDPLEPRFPGRGHQLYGGDLDGVVEHLDHLADLGVNLLYLTPFFPATSNHRYDAVTFDEVDPLLGGEAALVRLIEAAHGRGMKVIGDLTTNHSGIGHAWFVAAHLKPDAPEGEYYYFDDDHVDYANWLGATNLAKFNWASQRLRKRFLSDEDSVLKRWLSAPYHLDGWRIDVANMTGRHGTDDFNEHVRQQLRTAMIEVNPDTLVLAESANEATEDFRGDAWHGGMVYVDFTRPLWAWLTTFDGESWIDAEGRRQAAPWYFGQPLANPPQYTGRDVVSSYERFSAGVPWRIRRGTMHGLDTHDTARFALHAKPGTVEVAFGLAVTMPGIPMVWMGDEYGLTGRDGEDSRVPMPWSGEGADESTYTLYRALIALRRTHPALATGGLRWLAAGDDYVAFVRESPDESVLVLAARDTCTVSLPGVRVAGEVLWGEAALRIDGAETTVSARGPGLTVWSLPGVVAPPAH